MSDTYHIINPAGGSPRILLVEDDPATSTALSRLLVRVGYGVRTANTVASAVQLGLAEPFDVLICDVGLPDGDGAEVLRRIHQQRKLPGIVVSGYGT